MDGCILRQKSEVMKQVPTHAASQILHLSSVQHLPPFQLLFKNILS